MKFFLIFGILAVSLIGFHCEVQEYIIGGEEAEEHEFPFQVAFLWEDPPLYPKQIACGGTIIGDRFILTAAHCKIETGIMYAVAGTANIKNIPDYAQIRKVVRFTNHATYRSGFPLSTHDIALVELDEPFEFNEYVVKANLVTVTEPAEATVSGWGSIDGGDGDDKYVFPERLMKVSLPVLPHEACQMFADTLDSGYGKDISICAATLDGTKGLCRMDSGGPLSFKDSDGKSIVYGVVSYGPYPCNGTTPAFFTRVSAFMDWMEEQKNV